MSEERPTLVVRLVKGFAMFWWDFLVGDTPELFVAALVIIGVVALLSDRAGTTTPSPWRSLPLLAISALAISLRRAQTSARK